MTLLSGVVINLVRFASYLSVAINVLNLSLDINVMTVSRGCCLKLEYLVLTQYCIPKSLVSFSHCWHVYSRYNAIVNYFVNLKSRIQLQCDVAVLSFFHYYYYRTECYLILILTVLLLPSVCVCEFVRFCRVCACFDVSFNVLLLFGLYCCCLWAMLPDSK